MKLQKQKDRQERARNPSQEQGKALEGKHAFAAFFCCRTGDCTMQLQTPAHIAMPIVFVSPSSAAAAAIL